MRPTLIAALFSVALTAGCHDWDSLRGPGHDGVPDTLMPPRDAGSVDDVITTVASTLDAGSSAPIDVPPAMDVAPSVDATPVVDVATPPVDVATPCGRRDLACCARVPMCGAGLACADGVCRTTCGAHGQTCCPGVHDCDDHLSCQRGTCQPCGTVGRACCASDACGRGVCMGTVCQPCGLNGQACCPAPQPACAGRRCWGDGICR